MWGAISKFFNNNPKSDLSHQSPLSSSSPDNITCVEEDLISRNSKYSSDPQNSDIMDVENQETRQVSHILFGITYIYLINSSDDFNAKYSIKI